MNFFRHALTLALLMLLSGCQLQGTWGNTQKEASEAFMNLQQEATNVQQNVSTKIEQIQQAVESVGDAADAVDQAITDVKAVTETNEAVSE